MERIAAEVEEAASKFNKDLDLNIVFPENVHAAILDETQGMTGAIGALIRHAIAAQKEIVAEGKGSGSPAEFYLKNSSWTNGLISAAQAVAKATVLLVETANGALTATHTLEQLVVASNTVAAATAQLVTASRVKAVKRSVAQPLLEEAAKSVSDSNRRLVAVVSTSTIEDHKVNLPSIDNLQSYQITEMNMQADLQLVEKKLEVARLELAEIRRNKYQETEEGDASPFDLNAMNKQVEIKELEKRLAQLRLEYDMLQLKKPEPTVLDFDLVETPQASSNDHESLLY